MDHLRLDPELRLWGNDKNVLIRLVPDMVPFDAFMNPYVNDLREARVTNTAFVLSGCEEDIESRNRSMTQGTEGVTMIAELLSIILPDMYVDLNY